MSVSVEVHFPTARMPAPEAWQNSIQTSGFTVDLDLDFDPMSFTGYLPASYERRPAGFEYYHVVETDGTSRVSLRWGGNVDEAISAVIAAGCLSNLTGGNLFDTESGEVFSAHDSIGWARRIETDLRPLADEGQEQSRPSAQPASKPWWKFW